MLFNQRQHHPKKLPFILITAALSLMSVESALAQVGQRIQHKTPGSDIVQAINNLGYKMEAIALAGEKTTTELANAVDNELSNLIQLNTESNPANAEVTTLSTQNIQNSIHNSLAQYPNTVLTYSSSADPTIQAALTEKTNQNNLSTLLTLGINASDTLYSSVNNIDSATYYTQYPQSKPTTTYDQYFDINSLIGVDNYTPDQEQAAQYFITYLTRNYQSQTDGINFDQLQDYLDQFSDDPVTLGEKLQSFRNSDTYKKYQLNERSNIAAQSVSLKTLNDFLAERTPLQSQNPDSKLEAISKQMGVTPQQITIPDPNNPGQTISVWSYVSPLQINNYMANHRINDPKWYQQVAAGSTEDLLRNLVIIMAESESLSQQNHLDNEKILSALTTLNIQSANTAQLLDKNQTGQDLNKLITSFVSEGGSTTTDTTDNSNNTNTQENTTNTGTSTNSSTTTNTDTNGSTSSTTNTGTSTSTSNP